VNIRPKISALHLALLSAMTGLSAHALAQSPQATELDRITVTGSRIQTSQTVTASAPVAEISAEEFKFSGTTRVEDLLNQYPQMSPDQDAFSGITGFPTADLRGLGADRTLVLVNGQRLPPGGIRAESRDLSQIPSALVKRVDVLSGGASAVYGSDAISGVVNFVLDTEFEGISANFGYSGYQHDNDHGYMQSIMDNDSRGITYPRGNTALEGITRDFSLAIGSKFAEGRGHAMGWFTWRENDELRQDARDYSSCALNAAGTACGGSPTSPEPNFLITRALVDTSGNPLPVLNPDGTVFIDPATGGPVQIRGGTSYRINPDGSWGVGAPPSYNFSPVRYFQRPDKRITFGSALKYEINEHFKPFLDTLLSNTTTSIRNAESGTFFANELTMRCDDPLLRTFCTDIGSFKVRHGASVDANGNDIDPSLIPLVDASIDQGQPLTITVGKRNVEGGPRFSDIEANNFRLVGGVEGTLNDFWSYNLAVVYGRNSSTEINRNDFLSDRVAPALLGCPPGSYLGCVPYNVWDYNGVTAEQAADLSGIGVRKATTRMMVFNGYVTGAFDWGLPSAQGESIAFVAGLEHRGERYDRRVDSNMAAGNFTGLGGPRPPISGQIEVDELFLESQVPLFVDSSGHNTLYFDAGYRYSDYSTSGNVNTWKLGFAATFAEHYRIRGGYNRAIRAANTSELFDEQQIALWGGGDPCAPDENGNVRFTQAQCANTGLLPSQYGQDILRNQAAQYNEYSGGNPDLKPEQADTWTLGFVTTPIPNLSVSVDVYDIKITERIGNIGASTILEFCGLTGDAFLCDKIHRSASGDLWVGSSVGTSGYVENLNANFGDSHFRGVDLAVHYGWAMWNGWVSAALTGTHAAKAEWSPLPGVNDNATYDCAGVINSACRTPDWRHMLNLRYAADGFSVGLRWRYVGALDYRNQNGSLGTIDQLLIQGGHKLGAVNYLDLSGSYTLTDHIELSGGINNIADKTPPLVGSGLSANANSPSGYDPLGRFVFANVSIRF